MGFIRIYDGIKPLVMSQFAMFAIENCPVEIVSFPISSMVMFHSKMSTFTRGYQSNMAIDIRSGKRLHNYGKLPCLYNGKIHYFYGHFQ